MKVIKVTGIYLPVTLVLNRVASHPLKCAVLPYLEPKRHVPHGTDDGDTFLVFNVRRFLEYNSPASC